MDNDIVKIVYFDEGSAADYIQITNGGSLQSMVELVDEDTSKNGKSASAGAGIGLKSKLLKTLVGLDASAKVEGSLEASFSSGSVAKSILTNTVLTDFLEAVSLKDEQKDAITTFSRCRIEQIPGSVSSIALITPYLSMFKSGQGISAGEFDISIDKLDSTLSKAKGYLEFLGRVTTRRNPVVLRFNHAAFKNNYRSTDLLKMNLRVYAVQVGRCRLDDLAADRELSVAGFSAKDNPDFVEGEAPVNPLEHKSLLMFDAILAGVVRNG